MNKKFIILLFISTFFLTSLVRADGPATQYVITMTKVELCETGSSLVVTNCVNPVQISETGSTAAVDIAGLGASGAASFGNMSKAKVGSTYTHIRTTLSRLVTVTGQDNNITGGDGTCVTVNGNDGVVGKYALGATTGTPGSVTLVMPDTATYNVLGGMGATLDNTVAGSTASTITQVAGTIAAADTHFASISALGKSVTIKAGQIPTIKAAFGTANAVRANPIGEGGTTCASSTKTLSIAPPDVSITIE